MNRHINKGQYLHVLIALTIMTLLAWPFYMKRPKPMEFHSSQELVTFLQAGQFQNYKFVAQGQHPEIDSGGYLMAPHITNDPRGLGTFRELKAKWTGILLLLPREHTGYETIQRNLNDWGDMGIYRAGFLFFGDPDLIAKVAQTFP